MSHDNPGYGARPAPHPTSVPPSTGPGRSPAAASNAKKWLPLAVVAAIVVVGLLTWVIVANTGNSKGSAVPGDAPPGSSSVPSELAAGAPHVAQLANQVLTAAANLDVDAGLALLCTAPDADDLDHLGKWISKAKKEAGTDRPQMTLGVSALSETDSGGAFTVSAKGQGQIADRQGEVKVSVAKNGQRYCVEDVTVVDYSVRTSD